MPDQLAALIDKEAIRSTIATLARGEDRRDAELVKACWWPDAQFDYGVHSGDFATYLAWVVPGAEAIKNTQHILGQTHIVLEGDTARCETHAISYHRVDFGSEAGGEQDTCIGGRYLDIMAKRPDISGTPEWRIATRVMLYDWEQNWGASADWSKGVMGYPFTDRKFPGTAHGDWSETFFGKQPG